MVVKSTYKVQKMIQNICVVILMKQRINANGKNLVGERLRVLRNRDKLSQRDLAREFQLIGIDMDKNVITRIETNKRYVTDFELQAIKQIFNVSYDYLIDGIDDTNK